MAPRCELPSGSVTFLFTDVEGSTKLLHELGAEAYAEALAEHRRLIREACAADGGVEVDTQGDAFFFAFPTAPGAIAAASAFTDSLATGPIQVRVGLHTGAPLLAAEGYVGDDVHFAARVASSGHGGQVILSAATAELIELEVTSLGEHRLKDIAEAVAIFQLGDGSFPPLKTISNTNLPTPASSFVGRDDEVQEVLSRFEDGARLVTLTGPGGTGKTRLAIETAATLVPEYKAGVFWVALATLRDPALVTETIAQTLGAEDDLAEHIGEREMVLLLDNLEQVIEAAAELSELLTTCPNLTLLVTSRELLRIQGEVEYAVPPLAEQEAVELFSVRSQLVPDTSIAELCRRLDDMPLAVELAAARTSVLTPAQILERLSQRLDLLKGGRDADPRQQTLRTTIDWSYELLSDEETQLFARLSVFAGCTFEAAQEITGADLDTLQSLVEKSLVRFTDGRYWMLETIRDFAAEARDESGETPELSLHHACYYAQLAASLARPLREYSPGARESVQLEIDNMRAGLALSLDHDDVVTAAELLSGLWFYWLTGSGGGEGSAWAHRYLASPRSSVPPLDRFAGDLGASEILRFTGDSATAARVQRELVATGRANPGAVVGGLPIERSVAALLSGLAGTELASGDLDAARAYAEEALALRRTIGLQHGIAHALHTAAEIEYAARDFARAGDVYAEVAALYDAAESQIDAGATRLEQAECAMLVDRLDEATRVLRRALRGLHDVVDESIEVQALRVAGMLAAARGDGERAVLMLGAVEGKLQASGLAPFAPVEEELRQSYLERVRNQLGVERFQDVYAHGLEGCKTIGTDVALASLD